jgi:ABC-type bacteriocin/lantibiotic exporter with double-glycine peptidase domain
MRRYMRGGRYLFAAVVGSALASAMLEGVGVGLLVPLLSLLLGGEEATPMRPISWLQAMLPGRESGFYVLFFCGLVLGAIALKNAVLYGSLALSTKLKERITVNLRDALFERLHRAELSLFEQHPAGELANVFFFETTRTLDSVDFFLLFGQRASMAFFYLIMLLVISWPLTIITLLLTGTIGGIVAFLHQRLARRGQEVTGLNQNLSNCMVESFAGVRLVRATNSQDKEIARFHQANQALARAQREGACMGYLLVPMAETIAVGGAMVLVGFAYVLLVKPGYMLSSYLLGFGFILLRLLPLVNQLYALQGQLLFWAGGPKEVEKWLESPQYPQRPFGNLNFNKVSQAIRFEQVDFVYPNGTKALDQLTLTIPAGKKVAMVGASGSGKSTVATLLGVEHK